MFEPSAFIEDALQHAKENRHTRPPEPINRLLGISDDHQLARRKAGGIRGILCEQRNDLGLDLIRILEFVDQQRLEMILVMPPDTVMFFQQVTRAQQQVVEVERVRGALLRLEAFDEKAGECGEAIRRLKPGNLADPRQQRMRIIFLAQGMFRAAGFQFVEQFADFFESPAVFANIRGNLAFNRRGGFALILDAGLQPAGIVADAVEPVTDGDQRLDETTQSEITKHIFDIFIAIPDLLANGFARRLAREIETALFVENGK